MKLVRALGLAEDITGTIGGSLMTATVPVGTDVTALVPTITVSEGATVSPADGEAQDFSEPVSYRVTAQDGRSTTDYTVVVSLVEDFTAPVPGGSGAITLKPTDACSIKVSWTKATDEVYAAATLEYEVVRSDADDIASVPDAEANGTEVLGWTADRSSVTESGLEPGAQYWFNTLVRDGGGNVAAYESSSAVLLVRVASDALDYNHLGGYSVAISGDGSTLVMSAPFPGGSNLGSAYVFEKVSGTWTQKAVLTQASQFGDEQFGHSVAVSYDGSTVVVGAPYVDYGNVDSGQTYVYERPGGGWVDSTETTKFDTNWGPSAYQGIVVCVSSDGSTVAAGVSNYNSRGLVLLARWQTST